MRLGSVESSVNLAMERKDEGGPGERAGEGDDDDRLCSRRAIGLPNDWLVGRVWRGVREQERRRLRRNAVDPVEQEVQDTLKTRKIGDLTDNCCLVERLASYMYCDGMRQSCTLPNNPLTHRL